MSRTKQGYLKKPGGYTGVISRRYFVAYTDPPVFTYYNKLGTYSLCFVCVVPTPYLHNNASLINTYIDMFNVL